MKMIKLFIIFKLSTKCNDASMSEKVESREILAVIGSFILRLPCDRFTSHDRKHVHRFPDKYLAYLTYLSYRVIPPLLHFSRHLLFGDLTLQSLRYFSWIYFLIV
uniref:Uncharacterized protein n=1 Tax=Cacopsylla melanoneura TaxID=428564 RepID=A0A8D8TYD1_9HEMI